MTVTIHAPPARLDPALVRRWAAVSTTITADLCEGRTLADPALRPLRALGAGPRLAGRARTVRVDPPDFGAVLHAVDRAEPGDVIVIAAGGRVDVAVLGDILGGALRRRGAAGVVCDGALRDVATLAGWDDLPAFARGTTARGPSSKDGGTVDGPVDFAGLAVEPGMLVVGDDDGLVVLSRAEAEGAIAAAEERAQAERGWVARLEAGDTLAAVFGLAEPTVVRA